MTWHKNHDLLRQRIQDRHGLKSSDKVGVVGSFSKEMRADEKNAELRFIATTCDIDSADEVVVASGANRTYFSKQKAVFLDHDVHDTLKCVGKARSTVPMLAPGGEVQQWLCHVKLLELSNPAVRNDLLVYAQEGVLSCSIGFQATNMGRPTLDEIEKYGKGKPFRSIIRSWNWLELSLTCQPCNVNAQMVGMEIGGAKSFTSDLITKRLGVIDNLLCQGRVSKESAIAIGAAEIVTPKKKRIVIVRGKDCY